MKKGVIDIEGVSLPLVSVNTLIIGSGAASLNAAVELFDCGVEDIVIVTDRWGGGTSNNAGSDKQTYYKLSLAGKGSDSAYDMASDLYNGRCMQGDIALCEAGHSTQAFFNLVKLGVPFPHDQYGAYIGYKTDHDPRGRGTSAGPLTSHLMFEALAKAVKQRNIPVIDKHEIIALLKKDEGPERHIAGAVALNRDELNTENSGLAAFNAVNVILGTGGPAGMYKTSVYPVSQTGSHGLAFRIGAEGQNLTESQFGLASIKFRWNVSGTYQQVIPRYISTDVDGHNEREFLNDYFPDIGTLASAVFLKGYQWPFDPRKVKNYGSSLIDILVYRETVLRKRRVFLDYSKNPGGYGNMEEFSFDKIISEAYVYLENSGALLNTPIDRLKKMNQPAVDLYKNNGINIESEYLEIAVCAQHNNGGLKGNIWWESNIKHLFPVGEVNGSHGVYRPGGASLNSGQVGGMRAALYISENYKDNPPDENDFCQQAEIRISDIIKTVKFLTENLSTEDTISPQLKQIQERMSEYGAAVREPAKIAVAVRNAIEQLKGIEESIRILSPGDLPLVFKVFDLCLTHFVYLEAIKEYMEKGGRSRGSYIVRDDSGEKPCKQLEDTWKFRLNEDEAFVDRKILEIVLSDDLTISKKWVDVRPVPDKDPWFEKTWSDFREGKIIK
ncbi:FAD-binding protein [candidate division KSB1 bacterium]